MAASAGGLPLPARPPGGPAYPSTCAKHITLYGARQQHRMRLGQPWGRWTHLPPARGASDCAGTSQRKLGGATSLSRSR
eukprot:72567-Chlamydomonas_euryale.AAC.4